MPTTTIPLLGIYNTRPGIVWNSTPKDHRIIGAFSEVNADPIKGETSPFLTKRAGLSINSTITSGKTVQAFGVSDDGRFCFVMNDGTIYFKSNNAATAVQVGTGSGGEYVSVAYFNNDSWFLISGSGSVAFFLNSTAAQDATPTFTANTNTSTSLTNVSSFTNLYVGQALSGTDIPAGARIASMNTSANTITMTAAATGTTVGVTVTFEQAAKIIDADFPANIVGQMVFLDGFCFVMSSDGKIYNSDINDLTSWPASNFIEGTRAGTLSGTAQGLVLIKDRIIGMYSGSHEYFRNTGNAFGSPLTRIVGSVSNIGIFNFAQTGDYVFVSGAPAGQQVINCYLLTYDGAKEITTPPVSRNISQQIDQADAAYLEGGRISGMDFFIFEYISSSSSWMYCVQTERWFETGFAKNYLFAGGPFVGGLWATTRDDDSILYKVSSTVYQDGGVSFSMIFQSSPYYLNDGEPFWIDEVNLIADTQSSGSTTLATSADDYATFGTVGSFDLTQQQKNLPCGGYYDSSVAFKLTDSGNNAWRGQALKIKWRPAHT